jgi:transcriptional regulator with XRE-family HTH domain
LRAPSPRLGEVIRRQRELNRLTLRQFAALAGVSNPYLSQIERGHRAPSEVVLDAIARSLKTTRDELFEQAGMRAPDDDGRSRLEAVLRRDHALTERQRRVLLEVYDGLVAAAAAGGPAGVKAVSDEEPPTNAQV